MDKDRSGQMMTESQTFLLALVRMALWGCHEPLPENRPDWNQVFALSKQQTLIGLVAEAVPMLPSHLQPDHSIRIKLHTTAMRILQSHILVNRKVAEIKTKMDSCGIHTVLLKGQGVALNYPNPQSRQCGDIDLYVGESNFGKVYQMLEPAPLKKYMHLKHFSINGGGVEIEVHRIAADLPGIRRNRRFQDWTISNLSGQSVRKVEIADTSINLPPAEFDALYIMNHAWNHFMTGGIGLRQLVDWAMHLHRFHKDIDIENLRNYLQDFGLMNAWHILSGIAVKHLGLPAAECPLYEAGSTAKSDDVLEVIWDEGNFGHHSALRKTPRPQGYLAGKLYSFKANTSRITRILLISPKDVISTWVFYFINGIRHIIHKS